MREVTKVKIGETLPAMFYDSLGFYKSGGNVVVIGTETSKTGYFYCVFEHDYVEGKPIAEYPSSLILTLRVNKYAIATKSGRC